MPNIKQSSLLPILLRTEKVTGYCVTLVLCWIMGADGDIDDNEFSFLVKVSESLGSDAINNVREIIKRDDYIDLQLACEVLRDTLRGDERIKFFELVILMVIADGYVNFIELQIICFIADLLDIDSNNICNIYKNITGNNIPQMPDASSLEWWNSVENKNTNNNKTHDEQSFNSDSSTAFNIEKIKALAILGLSENASLEDIKSAYKRMVKIHHPDKFYSLGEEAVRAAEESFCRIQEAYDYLCR